MSNPTNRPLAIAKSRLPSAAKPATTRTPPLDQPLSYEEREIRNRAARVLENEEMLLLLSRQRYEVIFCLFSQTAQSVLPLCDKDKRQTNAEAVRLLL
jgi:hypothetical protein